MIPPLEWTWIIHKKCRVNNPGGLIVKGILKTKSFSYSFHPLKVFNKNIFKAR